MPPLGPYQNNSPDDTAFGGIDLRFQARLLDAVDQAVIVTDPQWKVAYWNRAAERLYGSSAEEVMGRPLLEVTPSAELMERAEEIITELMAGRSWKGEFVVRRKDGTPFSAHLTNTPVYDEQGALVAIIGVSTDITELQKTDELRPSEERFRIGEFVVNSRDITERVRAEERWRQAEARYRALVERMPAVTYIQEIGSPNSAMYMSPQIETLTGYSPEECKNPDLRWGMVHPDDRERMQSEDQRDVEPGEVVTTEYRVLHRDGRTVWVRNESVMIEDEESGSRYWQGFMLDITDRKHAEDALRRSEASLAEAQRIARLGSWEWDLKTGEVWWSDETYRIYGLEPHNSHPPSRQWKRDFTRKIGTCSG